MMDEIKIKLTPLPLNEFNRGKEKFKSLEFFVTKEPFKGKTNLYMPRLVSKSCWKDVSVYFTLGLL